MTDEEFKIYHSEIIMFFQIIEGDLKLIYSFICSGNIDDNYDFISKKSLGDTIKLLHKLDNHDGKPNISSQDYRYLRTITTKRNYWCHKNYLEFMYEKRWLQSREYQDQKEQILVEHKELSIVYKSIEKLRREICIQYER